MRSYALVVTLALAACSQATPQNGSNIKSDEQGELPAERFPKTKITPRKDHTAVAIGRKMLVYGGRGDNCSAAKVCGLDGVVVYDLDTKTWSLLEAPPPAPAGIWGHSAVSIGSKMLIWGGHWSDHSPDRNKGTSFEFETGVWSELPSSPLSVRRFHSAVAIGNKMIIWGGITMEDDKTVNDGAVFDAVTGEWKMLARSPLQPRFDHTAVVVDNKMMVIGGMNGEEWATDVATYDPANDSWSLVTDSFRYADRMTVSKDDRIYTAIDTDSPMVFDKSLNLVEKMSFSFPEVFSSRQGHSVVAVDKSIIFWGGSNYSYVLADGGILNIGSGSRTSLGMYPPDPRTDNLFGTWCGNDWSITFAPSAVPLSSGRPRPAVVIENGRSGASCWMDQRGPMYGEVDVGLFEEWGYPLVITDADGQYELVGGFLGNGAWHLLYGLYLNPQTGRYLHHSNRYGIARKCERRLPRCGG